MRTLRRLFAVVGALAILFLVVGTLLPGTWEVERSRVVRAPTDSLFRVLNRPRAWRAWMPWPESGASFEGPDAGPGAAFSWDDPNYGRGRLVITRADSPRSVGYRVSVEDGSVRIEGRIGLAPVADGTRIRWSEEGDFGWNPLLGWTALGVEERQGRALERALEGLGVGGATSSRAPAP